MKRYRLLSSIALGVTFLFLGMFFSFPTAIQAQVKDAGGITDVRNITGLVSCTDLTWFQASLSNNSCGNRFTTSGSFLIGDAVTGNQVPYVAGDIAKCSWTRLTSSASCVVSHANNTATVYETSAASSALTTTQLDANGNVVGTPTQQGAVEAITQPITNAAGGILADAASGAITAVASVILTFANLMLAMAGTLLNWVVLKTVFQFGTLIGNSPGVLVAWGILRDIGNMLLLFGFIFMGLATILDLHSFPTKKAIPSLLIFAILMNFSLFAAEAVIDTANTLSSVMYAQANTDNCAGVFQGAVSEDGQKQEDCATNYGIAGHIMQSTGLSSVFSVDNNAGLAPTAVAYIGLALFATIGAVVLFATSIMLIIRVVVLTFIMVGAPIGFAGMAIPPLRRFAADWWSKLIHQAFFAPILFLLIFVSLKVTDSLAAADTRGSLAAALTQPGASVMGVILVFTIVIGFLIGSLMAAKSFGAAGADFAVSSATRFVYGGVSRGTNLVFGGGATGLRYLQQTKYGQKVPGGAFVNKRILTPLSGANIDMRRIPGLSGALGRAGAGDAAKPGEHATFADMRHQYEEIRDNNRGKQRQKEYEARIKKQNLEAEAHDEHLSDDSKKFLAGLSTKELEELHGIKTGVAALARNLSPEQFDNLMKSDRLSAGEKGALKKARYSNIDALAKTGDVAALKQELSRMSKKDLEGMPADILMQDIVLDNLNDKQREDLSGSDKRTTAERAKIKSTSVPERINTDFTTALNRAKESGLSEADANTAAGLFLVQNGMLSKLTREQLAKLPKSVLTSEAVAQQFTPNVLMALQEEKGKFTPEDIRTIAKHITALGSGPAYNYINGQDSPGRIFWS